MKILHISTRDSAGGAAIAAIRLHKAMLAYGIGSDFLCMERSIDDDKRILTVDRWTKLAARTVGVFNQILFHDLYISAGANGLFSNMRKGFRPGRFVNLNEYDAIYIHWINDGFLSLKGLDEVCRTNKPVFWFMHDMFPITGGCHHSFDCNRYRQECGSCPYMKKTKRHDFSWQQLKAKRRILDKHLNLTFVAPSRWLYDCTRLSSLANEHAVHYIPNLLDQSVFRPLDKSYCRSILNLPEGRKIILFGASCALTNPYKGFNYLLGALKALHHEGTIDSKKILLVIFGSSYNRAIAESLPFESKFLGVLHDDFTLSMLYNSADVFCIPSVADNFPNTVLESLNCRTPIVGFNVGGIPDIVGHDTGYLARYRDSEDFARGIAYVLNHEGSFSFSRVPEFETESIVSRHIRMIDGFDSKNDPVSSGGIVH